MSDYSIFLGSNNKVLMALDEKSGNIGCGVTNPAYTLDVLGAARINQANTYPVNKLLVLYDPNQGDNIVTACNFFGFGINAGTVRYQTPPNQKHIFYNGSTECMRINTDGRVGIGGQTTPGSALDVIGTIRSSAFISGANLNASLDITGNQDLYIARNSFLGNQVSYSNPIGNPTMYSLGSNIGLNNTTPNYSLDITGSLNVSGTLNNVALTSTSNLAYSGRNICTTVQWNTYYDLTPSNIWYIPQETGNPIDASFKGYINTGRLICDSNANLDTNYSKFRFIFRAASASGGGGSIYNIQPIYTNDNTVNNIGSSWNLKTIDSFYGYSTYLSPWLSFYGGNRNTMGLKLVSASNIQTLRIGNVWVEYF